MGDRSRSAIFLALVFLCGALAGALLDRVVLKPQTARARASWDNENRLQALQKIRAELDLNDEQCRRVEEFLDEATRDFDDLHSRAHAVRVMARERIKSVLNEPQKRKFEQAMARLQKTMDPSQ